MSKRTFAKTTPNYVLKLANICGTKDTSERLGVSPSTITTAIREKSCSHLLEVAARGEYLQIMGEDDQKAVALLYGPPKIIKTVEPMVTAMGLAIQTIELE